MSVSTRADTVTQSPPNTRPNTRRRRAARNRRSVAACMSGRDGKASFEGRPGLGGVATEMVERGRPAIPQIRGGGGGGGGWSFSCIEQVRSRVSLGQRLERIMSRKRTISSARNRTSLPRPLASWRRCRMDRQ